MAKKSKHAKSTKPVTRFVSKKCPNCQVYLKLDEVVCHSCKAKLGDVDRLGMAKKPVNWKAYLSFLVALAIFSAYIWWAFFSGMERL